MTGLPIFASQNSLYYETGWDTHADRHKNKKLNLMYKITNSYLSDLLPNRVNEVLRNSDNYQIPFSRLCSFDTSFFPATLRLWNDLDQSIRNSSTIAEFKSKLKTQSHKDRAIFYFFYFFFFFGNGDWKLTILLTRIRHNCSILNADLHRVKIVPSPTCSCGALHESSHHYFFECSNCINQRNNLLRDLSSIPFVTLDALLYGCSTFDEQRNSQIINAVLLFIKDSNRFD